MHLYKRNFAVIFSVNIVQLTAFPNSLIGCFEDKDRDNRVLNGNMTDLDPNGSDECKMFCQGFRYFGTESGEECFCGNEIRPDIIPSVCTDKCESNPDEYCGGHWRILIYDTWHCIASPCKNGAECEDINSEEYICNCTEGWEGDTCENEKLESSSSETSLSKNYTIIRTITTIKSIRTSITINSQSGTNTGKMSADCIASPCKNEATCEDIDSEKYICNCTEGWEGDTCENEKRESSSKEASLNGNSVNIWTITTIHSRMTNITTNSQSGEEKNITVPLMYVLLSVVAVVLAVTLIVVLVVFKRRNQSGKASNVDVSNDVTYTAPYSTAYSIPANETENQNKSISSSVNLNKGNAASRRDDNYELELEDYNVINLRSNNRTTDNDSYDHVQQYAPCSQDYNETTYNKLKLCQNTSRDRNECKDVERYLYDHTDVRLSDRTATEYELQNETKAVPNDVGNKGIESVEENVYTNDVEYSVVEK